MDDAYTHSYYVEIGGYQVWPLSWPVIAGLLSVILLTVAIGIVFAIYNARRDKSSRRP
jgi:uncharacterized membrane protein